jgi:hypothetical protein
MGSTWGPRDAEAALGPPPCPYALLVVGSGARRESTLRTDQDHALVLADDAPPGAGAWFAALAERLAATLERCGLPRCPGDVMATNPAWRMPLAAWQDRFIHWIEQPDEDALLEAAIFFDCRQLHGQLHAGQPLGRAIHGAAGNRRFLGRLAAAAVRRRPPAGFLYHLRGERRAGSTSRHKGPPQSSTWPACSRWRRAGPRQAPLPACMPRSTRERLASWPSTSPRHSRTYSSSASSTRPHAWPQGRPRTKWSPSASSPRFGVAGSRTPCT